jgi:hypothetical protein
MVCGLDLRMVLPVSVLVKICMPPGAQDQVVGSLLDVVVLRIAAVPRAAGKGAAGPGGMPAGRQRTFRSDTRSRQE